MIFLKTQKFILKIIMKALDWLAISSLKIHRKLFSYYVKIVKIVYRDEYIKNIKE